jgi:site-specific DNA-methyltransferase (cytosine-N4-specific)
MQTALLEWHRYRYFPYERDFARLEVASLLATKLDEVEAGLHVSGARLRFDDVDRLTYFARVVRPDGRVHIPRQVRLEASVSTVERERQSTRYSAHGLHEYKGKFNPQVVRAIGNILGLDESACVLDPFCGSGTTLLECAHAGWNAIGVDRNPLAVHIANAKLHSLRQSGGRLERLASDVMDALAPVSKDLDAGRVVEDRQVDDLLGRRWEAELPCREYLAAWFPRLVLAQIVATQRALRAVVPDPADRAVFDVVLSDQLRNVSLQEPLDLRVRRRKDPASNYPLVDLFVEAVQERLPRITRARAALGEVRGAQAAHLADIRETNLRALPGAPRAGFDAIITSPPYATALPYIDTQRLSLVLLGLIEADAVADTERALIGARELSTTERRALDDEIRAGTAPLPTEVFTLCRDMLRAAELPGNGFRRQNTPALLFRYCRDMAAFFRSVRPAMKPGAPVALVVGRNRTTLGGREFAIDTPALLVAIAMHCGYKFVREEPMDTYPRYDMHQRNAINAETLIVVAP